MKGFRTRLRCLGTSERGALLVEALFSAVVVALAFAATTMAFNSSTSSATRDINKSGALTVAQSQLEYLRSVGQTNINDLVAMDNTSRTVSYGGVDYTISYRAYYVDSMGGSNTNSCGSFATSGSTSAQYIYIKATVSYEIPVSAPAFSMDSYFAPEGGSSQSSTGTLKVFVLSKDGAPMSFPTTVNLRLNAATVDSKTLNANGCVLFTGLARGVYTISVPDSNLQDLYMTSTGNVYERNVSMPARGAIVQKVQLAAPVTITPTFKTMSSSTDTAGTVVTPSTANDFVKDTSGANPNSGMWVGMNSNVTLSGFTDYTLNPGKVFMPHFKITPSTQAEQLYPDPAGYSTYAGACTVNNPAPVNLRATTGPSWTAPELWLTRLRATANVVGGAEPTPTSTANYYWGQTFALANVKVRLVGDLAGNSPAESDCGPRGDLYNNTWVDLGNITGNSGSVAAALQALPTGEYEICTRIDYKYSAGKGVYSAWTGWSMGNKTTGNNGTQYVLKEGVNAVKLPYKVEPVLVPSTLTTPGPTSGAACG